MSAARVSIPTSHGGAIGSGGVARFLRVSNIMEVETNAVEDQVSQAATELAIG